MSAERARAKAPALTLLGAEYRALDKVPRQARVFGLWDQAALWFGAASLPAAWYYGALMAGWQGLPGALLFIVLVSALTLVPWAFLGHIAADTGGASIAIVRPAFGLRGSLVPSLFYLVFGLGWGAVNVFLGAIATSFILKATFGWPAFLEPGAEPSMAAGIVFVCAVQGLFAVLGHRAIRWMERAATLALVVRGHQRRQVSWLPLAERSRARYAATVAGQRRLLTGLPLFSPAFRTGHLRRAYSVVGYG